WFNSLRSGFGIFYQALRTGEANWHRWSEGIRNLVLSAPEVAGQGFIPGVYDYQNRRWWYGVTRLGAGPKILDLAASAHTGWWMLRWHRYLKPDERLIKRCQKMAAGLVSLQAKDGSFPAYLDEKGRALPLLEKSAQAAMAALFLAELYAHTRAQVLLPVIQSASDFFIREIIPKQRYHDFETFFSCSEKPLDFFDHQTGQPAQNTLSLFWITKVLLHTYEFTGKEDYLQWGLRCLDQLSLYQQVWNPPFLSLYTFGGFGVMNTDGEWNDMRQAFFSEVYFQAFLLTKEKEYLQRAVACLRAGYAQMSHPIHQKTNPLRYDTFPPGLVPENFAHTGQDGRAIRSGFDWGAGALVTMTAFTETLYGSLLVEADSGVVVGIDGLEARLLEAGQKKLVIQVKEGTGVSRPAKVVIYKRSKATVRWIQLKAEGEKIITLGL
ncbi:MAG: hypothetical protein NC823_00515, partial [Candidatus Omnitrophica bacterium]|nr:hypothetical protein [Candidatus Omnitrophota bacterium]